jgi:hypothetical protein
MKYVLNNPRLLRSLVWALAIASLTWLFVHAQGVDQDEHQDILGHPFFAGLLRHRVASGSESDITGLAGTGFSIEDQSPTDCQGRSTIQ